MTPLELYQVFLGMKLHFTQKSYDYSTYGPRRVGEEAMGKYFVLAGGLSRKFGTKEALETRLIALFKNKVVWLNEIATPEAEKAERQHLGILNTLSYQFQKDLSLIKEESPDIIEAFSIENKFSIPLVSTLLLRREISLETYCILDDLIGFSVHINGLVWKGEHLRVEKYKSFFKPDLKEMSKIARPYFDPA